MLDDLRRCYEVLGVAPQASAQELKAAYRDLAKVWHPDRFAHEPRLQQKAQEKLKEINEAYAQLTSDPPARRTRPTSAPATERANTTPAPFVARRPRRQTLLLPALLFVVVLCAATTALLVRRKPHVSPPAQSAAPVQAQANASEQAAESVEPGGPAAPRQPKKRPTQSPPPSVPAPPRDAAAHARNTEALHPMPTVTLLIDPTTNLIATRACQNKMRMTYASGTEPHQLCTAHQAGEPAGGGQGRRRVAVR